MKFQELRTLLQEMAVTVKKDERSIAFVCLDLLAKFPASMFASTHFTYEVEDLQYLFPDLKLEKAKAIVASQADGIGWMDLKNQVSPTID
jgi:hypothetical protein